MNPSLTARVRAGALAAIVAVLAAACSGGPTGPTFVAPPPGLSLICPDDVAAESPDGQPTSVTWPALTVTGGAPPVTVACTPPAGNLFPVGETRVECRASDTAQQQASCGFTVTMTRQPRLNRTNFMAFGDSITSGVVADPLSTPLTSTGFPSFILNLRPELSYPTRLLAKLRERYVAQGNDVRVSNYGVSGERLQEGVVRLSSALVTERPQVLLLLHGANNTTGPNANSRTFIINRLTDMARDARSRGARVFIATLPPPLEGGRNAIPRSLLIDLNNHIRILAQGEGAVLVDVFGALDADVRRYIGNDGLHPTDAGYQRMADEFFEAIKRDLEPQ